MRIEGTHIIWTRDEGGTQIAPNFKLQEFECKCGVCDEQRINLHLVAKAQIIRDRLESPVQVTSAYRCAQYQIQLRVHGLKTAVGRSTHETGDAIDLACPPRHDLLLNTALTLSKAVGIAKTFVHIDERRDKVRQWAY